jgi:thioredoxin 1
MKLKAIADKEFKAEVLESNMLTLVYFRGDWARLCRLLDQSLEAAAEAYKGIVRIVMMDVDHCALTALRHHVERAPTLLYFSNGEEFQRDEGMMSLGFIGSRIRDFLGTLNYR